MVKSIKCKNEVLLIIDQYKDIYDENSNFNLNKLKNYIQNEACSVKLLICLSVNNTNIKNSLINELNYGKKEAPTVVNYNIKNNNQNKNNDLYEKKIDEEDLEHNQNYNQEQDDGQFENILFFKNSEEKNNNNNETIENYDDSINEKNNKDEIRIANDNYSENENNQIDIIYLNELISVKDIEDDFAKYLDLFDYNPKYYIKFKKFSLDKKVSMEDLYKKFLKETEKNISDKIKNYYKEINYNVLKNESIVELIKLKDLVDNRVTFTAPVLIEYIKEFPMKYIKIKVYIEDKNDNTISNNIIKLNTKFNNTQFYFEFCFPFFGLIISKLIYTNQNSYSIAYNELSGSAKGSFIEQKIRKTFVLDQRYGKILLKYVWNFNDIVKDIPKDFFQYDFENFKRLDYDDKYKNIEILNSIYYIVPGSQTNKNIDSILLIPDLMKVKEKHFKLISFQIKQGNDFEIKNKREYIISSLTAKKKFEELYSIKISRIFFYFIIGKEFKIDEDIINNLDNKKIEFLFFSYIEQSFYQKDNLVLNNLKDLINSNAEIFPIDDKNEEKNLFNKFCLINKLDESLRKKRNLLGIKITRNSYENGRKIIFTKDKGLRCHNKQRLKIIDFLKNKFDIKSNFTIKYVFYIKPDEYYELYKYDDLFGIYYYEKNYYIIHNYCFNKLDKNIIDDKNIKKGDNKILVDMDDFMKLLNKDDKRQLRSQIQQKTIKLEDINNGNYIYVFKIFNI